MDTFDQSVLSKSFIFVGIAVDGLSSMLLRLSAQESKLKRLCGAQAKGLLKLIAKHLSYSDNQ